MINNKEEAFFTLSVSVAGELDEALLFYQQIITAMISYLAADEEDKEGEDRPQHALADGDDLLLGLLHLGQQRCERLHYLKEFTGHFLDSFF